MLGPELLVFGWLPSSCGGPRLLLPQRQGGQLCLGGELQMGQGW